MMSIYTPATDPEFQAPYIDVDEWRDGAVRTHYIHGGFTGTNARFSFFFPEKEQYQGRFYQFIAPAAGSENASIGRQGEADKIAFSLTHGAYFVETNMGVGDPFAPIGDPTIIYRASAAAAEYSRSIAQELYGPHRPYGYIYGGSGGGYKSTSCFENTSAWDGAVPYIIGSPVAIPNMFTMRALARRVLRHKLPLIADAMEPGGDTDYMEKLTDDEKAVWLEAMKLGYPTRSWFFHEIMDDGALPVLTPGINSIDPTYYHDFWNLPGYEGTNPNGTALRDRIVHETVICDMYIPSADADPDADMNQTGADDSWKRNRGDKEFSSQPLMRLASVPTGEGLYLYGATITLLSGASQGRSLPIEKIDGTTVTIGAGYGQRDMLTWLGAIQPGDKVSIDNSDYIALSYFHRHQVPDESYTVWNQFRDESGKPLYPQRPRLVGPMISAGGCGSLQSGRFTGKMIVVAALMDESAFPWQADWYRKRVQEALGDRETEQFRLWYMDHALHDDQPGIIDATHVISYLGGLHQALLDLADWVEKDIAPAPSSVYMVHDGQLSVPNTAAERSGIQPVVHLTVNGGKCAHVKCGEPVFFSASVETPAGRLVKAEWSFEGQQDYPVEGVFSGMNENQTKATVAAEHRFDKPGTYFPVVRVMAQRQGNQSDVFTQTKNLSRVRVIAK